MGLSVIIPVYNEADSILETIHRLHDVLVNSTVGEYEIIVVNDGSTDQTLAVLEKNNLGFRLISHNQNRGYGAALKTGIRQSQYDIIGITDADGTYPLEELPKLFEAMKSCDMAVGARTGEKVRIPWGRRPAKWVLARLANYLAETRIPDLNSGLRVFRKNDALRFFSILPKGFSFTTTITLAMLTNDMRVDFFPVNYMKRKGKSKIRPLRDTLNFVQLIVRTILYFNPLKVFVPVALFFLMCSLGIFLYSALAMDRILDTTVSIFFVAAVQMLSIGMIADIIDKKNKL